MNEELFKLAQDPTYSIERGKEMEEETILPRNIKQEENLSRLAQDPTYTPERKGAAPVVEDYLFLSYPNKKEAITEARVRGYSDDVILKRLALYEKDMLLRKQPADVGSSFGRTDDSEAKRKRYLQMNRVGAISKVTGLDPKEVFIRIKEAEAVGVNPEAFFADEDFYRLAKSSGVVKERMSIAQNVINGVKISKLRDERGALYHDNLLRPSDGITKRIQEIDKEISELMPPAYNPGLNKAFFDAANSMGSWVDSQDLWMAAGGLAFGALAAPFIVPAAGVTLGTAAIGATAVSAVKMAYNTSMVSRMFLRESAEFNEDLVKEGVPQYAALPASALYGAVSAGIEFNMFSGVLSSFGKKIGGDMIMDYVRGYGKRAIKGFAVNPAIAPRLEKLTSVFMAKQALKSPSVAGTLKTGLIRFMGHVWDEDVEEMMQQAASIIIGEPLKMAMLPDYKHMTLSEALGSIADAGIEALPSLTLMMVPGSAYSTARNIGAVRSFQNSGEGKRVKAAENILTDEGAPVAENNLVFLGQDAVNEFFQSNPDIADEVVSALGITESNVIDELGEVAVRKEDYEKAAAAHPSFAKSLEMDTREGSGGITKREVAERLSKKLQDPLEQGDEYAKEAVEIRRNLTNELSAASRDDEASQANADLYSRYLYTLGKRLKISPKELHKMRVEKAEGGRANPLYNQSVWHGSPHKFDKFGLEHIGSGEGAQAFGWGLYFADNKEVSEWYRKKLSKKMTEQPAERHVYFNGNEIFLDNNINSNILDPSLNVSTEQFVLNRIAFDVENNYFHGFKALLRLLKEDLKQIAQSKPVYDPEREKLVIYPAKYKKRAQKALKWINENEGSITSNLIEPDNGQLFKVDIPDETHNNYLLWDKAVPAEQMEKVLKVIKERDVALPADVTFNGRSFAGMDYGEMIDELDEIGAAVFERIKTYVYYGDSLEDAINRARESYERDIILAGDDDLDKRSKYDEEMFSEQARVARDKLVWLEANKDSLSTSSYSLEAMVKTWGEKGRNLYEDLSDELGSDKEASLLLRDAGIAGIKYLDGASRHRGEGNYNYVIFDDQAVKVLETYYQPINTDVDLNRKIKVILSAEKFNDETALAVRNGEERRKFVSGLAGKYHNDSTGWELSLPPSAIKHSISSAVNNKNVDYRTSIEIISELPLIIKNAVLIESHDDGKNASNVKKIHRMFAPISFNNAEGVYVVMLTVKEMDGTFDMTVEGVYKAHDVKGVKNIPDTKPLLPAHEELPEGNVPDIDISIGEMLSNVKDNDGVAYLQRGKGNRGGITFNRKTGESLVTLFRTADRSTFIHEMGHLILEDLIRYGNKADPETEISHDLKTVLDYLEISNMDISDLDNLDETQQARLTEAHEKWARAMETYVMEGNSPSKALRPVLQKMRMWLLDIYSNAKFAGEELTPEVQDVFDRLLATPQEIDESYVAETTIGDLIKENELLKERLDNFEKEKKREINNKFRLGEALGYDRGKSEGERGAKFKRPGFDYKTKSKREAMFERFEKRKALLKDVEALLEGINHDVNDENVIWSVQQEMLEKLAESRQIVDLHDTELDRKRPGRRRRKSKFAAVYPTQKMKMAASLMEAIKQDLGLDYREINPADAPFVKLIEKLEAAGMTLNDLRLSDAKLSEIADLAKEISEIHARGRREYEVWRAGIVEQRNKINAELVSALDKTDGKAKQGPITGSSDLSKQYDGVMGRAEKLKDWTYANTLGAIRLFDWIGHGMGKFDSAFSKYCVDEVNMAYDTKLRHIHERHDKMNAKMKALGITLHDLSKRRTVGAYSYSVDELLSIYTATQNEKSLQALIFGNMRDLVPDSWFLDNAKNHDAQPPAEVLTHIGDCIKALTPQERELADYVIQEYDSHYERMNNIFIATFNQGMMKEENYTPMHRLEYTSNHGLVNADEAAYAKGVASQAGAQKAGLERGFLNPRVIPGKEINARHQAPMDLGLLSIWNTQVDAMEHTAAFARIGPNLHAVFTENFEDRTGRSYNIPKLIREKFGSGTWKAVQEYINLVNRDGLTVGNDVFSRISNTLGKNMAYTYLAANIATVLKQTTSIPRFLITAGPAQIGCAIGEYLQHPKQFLEDIYVMDPQMRDRVPNVFFSINKYDPTIMGDAQYAYKKSIDTLIAPISYMDRVVAAIGWKATYESNVKRGLSHDQAVRAAQRAVLLTQQTPSIKDAPMIWRQSGLARLLMIFTSDAAPVLGMTVYDLAQSIKRGDHPASLCNIAAFMISAVAMKALVDGMPDDDNDENWGEWIMSAFSRQAIESIPLVGKELMSFWESFSGQGYKGTTYSAFVAPLSKLARGFDDMTADDSDEISPYTGMSKFERGAWNAIEGMSLITTPLPVVGSKRLYLATNNAADGDFMKALQAIIGQRKTMKKYSISPEI
ncbi:hypothetical protein [Cloacibacillus porcorum]|uniref:Large polyvalent protein-associated domain-containing protein n=1 Tax=Cloacibacillus porcorum TaxID=1197717 RepID=A0A1B2I2P4_9BACT|nr:hypothetical protein [Cloacibacillus porcorum]ANZ44239.1 hypothetical protein BED41_03515 [Cloacibacillus porcorum]